MSTGTNRNRDSRTAQLESELRVARELIDSQYRSDELYRTILNASPNAIIVIDPERTLEFASRRAKEMFGVGSGGAIVGRSVLDLVTPAERQHAAECLMRVKCSDAATEQECRLLRLDGTEFPASVSAAPWRMPGTGQAGAVLIIRDLTEEKAHAARLRASEERFRQVVESISEVFWILDGSRAELTYVSPNIESLFGVPQHGATLERWLAVVHPEDRERMARVGASVQNSGAAEETYRIVRPGGVVRWFRMRVYLLESGSNERCVVGVSRDITDEKELERQLLQAQRLEAVGTLASGISHDINNILAPMLIIPRLIEPKLSDEHDRRLLRMIEENARRGADIVKQLLAFSRGGKSHRALIALPPLLNEMANLMRETFPRDVAIEVDVSAGLPMVNADPTQIHQVLMNLCVNARDAMPTGGTLRIEVATMNLTPAMAAAHFPAQAGLHLVVSVIDTGTGIPSEIVDRIFDPFFTTKPLGHGTGLGLSTVRGIIRGHEGFVTVTSEVGAGTRFDLYLPAESADAPAATRESAALPAGRGERILVVDDEPAILDTLERCLRRYGYDVVVAANGIDAIRLLQAEGGAIQALVTDLMMPKLGGLALIFEARKQYPELPVVAVTGMADHGAIDAVYDLGVHEVLTKPITTEAILRAVRGCFELKSRNKNPPGVRPAA